MLLVFCSALPTAARITTFSESWFGVWGLEFGVWGLGFGGWVLSFVVQVLVAHRGGGGGQSGAYGMGRQFQHHFGLDAAATITLA